MVTPVAGVTAAVEGDAYRGPAVGAGHGGHRRFGVVAAETVLRIVSDMVGVVVYYRQEVERLTLVVEAEPVCDIGQKGERDRCGQRVIEGIVFADLPIVASVADFKGIILNVKG